MNDLSGGAGDRGQGGAGVGVVGGWWQVGRRPLSSGSVQAWRAACLPASVAGGCLRRQAANLLLAGWGPRQAMAGKLLASEKDTLKVASAAWGWPVLWIPNILRTLFCDLCSRNN